MMKLFALITLVFAMSCGPVSTASPSVSPSTAPTTSASPSASAIALPGSMFSITAERDMVSFYADRGALVAYRTKDAPPPYDSQIVRAETPGGPWKLVYESDARFMVDRVSSGRIGFGEYREPYQGGGAYSETFVVIDLASAQRTEIDRFAMTAASYRGGGAAPRRPFGAMALGPEHVAWTRLIEGSAGSVTGELRIAPLSNPTASRLIASSTDWVRPLALDAQRLVYVLASKTEESLHVLEVSSGVDKVVATGAVGNTVLGEIPGWDFAAVSGDWLVWLDGLKGPSPKGNALNLVSGEERVLVVGGSSCSGVSAGSRYFVWACGRVDATRDALIIDAKTLANVRPIPAGTGVGLVAADDGLIWFNVVGSGRTVTLYRP